MSNIFLESVWSYFSNELSERPWLRIFGFSENPWAALKCVGAPLEFFMVGNPLYFFDQLGDETLFRVIPNQGHGGVAGGRNTKLKRNELPFQNNRKWYHLNIEKDLSKQSFYAPNLLT